MFTDPYLASTRPPSMLLLLCRKAAPPPSACAAGRARGFTLIELMIAIAIVCILVAVALPSYREHVRKSRRAEAQAYLMAVAGRQQQFLVDSRAYAATLATVAIPAPANVTAAYDVTLAAVAGPPPTFLVSATPKSGTDQTRERCGILTVDQTGTKTASLSSCW